MLWVWRWLVFTIAVTAALPVPEETTDTSTKLIGSSVVTSVSVVMGEEDGPEKSDTRKVTEDLPASTVDMLKPDGFQFYTVDDKGQLITRQMTDAEIQSIIAAGGGPFPMETQDPQKTGENMSGDMKVADVVQNVQNVLKGELNKPPATIGTMPTIPGHANEEWSSILPAILGGDTESAPVTLPESDKPDEDKIKHNVSEVKSPNADNEKGEEKLPVLVHETETKKEEDKETGSSDQGTSQTVKEQSANDEKEANETSQPSEIPMVQVPVITADSVHSTTEAKPVYQILNTISADKLKNKDDEVTEGTKIDDEEPVKVSTEIIQVTENSEDDKKSVTTTPLTVEMGVKDSDELKTEIIDTQKVVATPSIVLEAPITEDSSKTEEKFEAVVADDESPKEKDKTEKTEETVEGNPTTEILQTEATSLADNIEQEVSQIGNMMAESISSIVDDLVSTTTMTKTDEVTTDASQDDKMQAETETKTQSEVTVTESTVTNTEKTDDLIVGTTLASAEKKPETLLTELADSVSSMISQVSEIMPAMVPIPQKSETTDLPVKRVEDGVVGETSTVKIEAAEVVTEMIDNKDVAPEVETQNPEKPATELIKEAETTTSSIVESPEIKQTTESPIQDLQKTSTNEKKPEEVAMTLQDSEPTKILETGSGQEVVKQEEIAPSKPMEESKPEMVEILVKKPETEAPIVRIDITDKKPTDSETKDENSTESSVVRIQLMNPVSTINQMIESAPERDPPAEVADIKFDEKNILKVSAPQNIGSSLIAGEESEKATEYETTEVLIQLKPSNKIIVEKNSNDEVVSVTTPEVYNESNTKSPATTSDKFDENKYEKPASADPIVPQVAVTETAVDSSTKNVDEEKTTEANEKVVEESVDIPKVAETSTVAVPQEVVISTSVEIEPTKGVSKPENEVAVKIDEAESAKPDVENNDETKIASESSTPSVIIENKPESENTETKVGDDTNFLIQNSVPVEVVTNAAQEPQIKPSHHVQDLTTLPPASGEKTTEKIETQADAEDVKTESSDVKIESPAKAEETQSVKETSDSATKLEVTESEKSEVKNPENVGVDESSGSNSSGKDQASIPLVRIDISPEKSQTESTTTTRTEEIPESKKPEISAPVIEDSSPKPDEPLKNVENVKDESVQPEKLETLTNSVESSSKAPETAPKIDDKLAEVPETTSNSVSSASTPKTEMQETTAKPVVRINDTPNNVPPKTQEIRIQVNDTAVLVTKQKIPEKVSETKKKVESTEIPSVQNPAPVTDPKEADKKVESTTESKKPSVVVDPYVKLGEKNAEKKPSEVEKEDATKKPTAIVDNKKPVNNMESNKEGENKWTLIPQGEPETILKTRPKPPADEQTTTDKNVSVNLEAHQSAVSLAESTRAQDEDISLFAKLCNELAFSFWIAANKGLSTARSLALSPFGMTSMLAMVFLGARGPTSGQMNDILKLDDVVTFNPHLVFQNVTDSVNLARGQGIANAAFVRELFADKVKAGRLLPFYRERAQQFYDGHVEEVNFAAISDLVRRRTNLLVRRQTGGRIRDFVKGNVMPLRSPLAALSANVFQTDCNGASSEGRDGEMYFAVLPAVRQRKLVPVPATVWRSGVLAGYEPGLDATVISLGGVGNLVSTIFVLPGQQGLAAPGDSLDHLERRLLEGAFVDGVWDRLLKVLIPRMGLEVQVPKFSHRSVVNATAALKRMGLDELFSNHADLKGINGVGNDLHLADMLQINLFSTCGDEVITGGRHHVEIYPASPLRGARGEKRRTSEVEEDVEDESKKVAKSLDVGEYVELVHELNKRSTSLNSEERLISDVDNDGEERSQRSSNVLKESLQHGKGKQNDRPLLKLDRPFLYFVRHNPTGMILHMGRFNPRLMP